MSEGFREPATKRSFLPVIALIIGALSIVVPFAGVLALIVGLAAFVQTPSRRWMSVVALVLGALTTLITLWGFLARTGGFESTEASEFRSRIESTIAECNGRYFAIAKRRKGTGSYRDLISLEPFRFELSEPHIEIQSVEVSPAEKENGVTWKGAALVTADRYRFSDDAEWISHKDGGTPIFQAVNRYGMPFQPTLVRVVKKNGVWDWGGLQEDVPSMNCPGS